MILKAGDYWGARKPQLSTTLAGYGGEREGRKGREGGTDHRVCLTVIKQEYGCARPRPRTN